MKKIFIPVILLISLCSCSQTKDNKITNDISNNSSNSPTQENQAEGVYRTFEDDNHKYGIMNQKGDIVIKPVYDGLEKRSDFYYLTHTDKQKDNFVWLDVQNKKLIILPNYADCHLNINKNMDVLFDNDQKMGVVQNGSKIIIPFIYQSIEKFGLYIFAKRVEESSVDIFDNALKKIDDHVALKDVIFPKNRND